jgi:VanZ family protein
MKHAGADRRREQILAWGAVALWTGVILILSTDSFSASETSRIIDPLLNFFFPGLDAAARELVHAGIRKSAHVCEYAMLGGLVWSALGIGSPERKRRSLLLAISFVVSVAALDELGQATRSSRTGSPRDVALDTAGSIAGIGLAHGARTWQRRREKTRP